jgi:hypothetical protein
MRPRCSLRASRPETNAGRAEAGRGWQLAQQTQSAGSNAQLLSFAICQRGRSCGACIWKHRELRDTPLLGRGSVAKFVKPLASQGQPLRSWPIRPRTPRGWPSGDTSRTRPLRTDIACLGASTAAQIGTLRRPLGWLPLGQHQRQSRALHALDCLRGVRVVAHQRCQRLKRCVATHSSQRHRGPDAAADHQYKASLIRPIPGLYGG